MPFEATNAAFSADRKRLSIFRKHLMSSVFAALIVASACSGALAQEAKYFNADGTKTNDFAAARKTWQADVEFNGNWGLKAIGADAAYALGIAGEGVKLSVFDTPVWRGHPEFATQEGSVFPKLTFLPTSGIRTYTDPRITVWHAGDPFKFDGTLYIQANGNVTIHGIHVAGIAAANRDGKGILGTAYKASIIAATNGDAGPEDGIVKGNDGGVYYSGWKALADSGTEIITNSWGIGIPGLVFDYRDAYAQFKEIKAIMGTPEGGTYDGALYAARKGVVLEFSAGNNRNEQHPDAIVGLPSFVPGIEKYWLATASVAASATSPSGVTISDFSSRCGYTKYYCVVAPGTQINSGIAEIDTTGRKKGDFIPDGEITPGYGKANGTSMAGPFATGTWALIKARFPYLAGGEVNEILKTTSTDLGVAGVDDLYGWGLVSVPTAMKGPGQFLTRFEANLPAGTSDIWSNNISQTGLDQRKKEEDQEVADWTARKIQNGWQDGISEAALSEKLKAQRPAIKDLLSKFGTAVTANKYEVELQNIRSNLLATAIYDRFVGNSTYGGVLTPEPGSTGDMFRRLFMTDFNKFLASFTVLDSDLLAAMSDTLEEYERTEARTKAFSTTYEAGLTKSGAGKLSLTGKNTFRGDTIVNGGELNIDLGGSIISAAIVNDTGLLSVDGTAAKATINNGGALKVNVTGVTGDLTLNGGAASIDGKSGGATVNGMLAGDGSVASWGMLGGNGTVGALVANNGGMVSPGNSIGKLTASGDATFGKGSKLFIEVLPGSEDARNTADILAVTGKALLNGGWVWTHLQDGGQNLSSNDIAALYRTPYQFMTYAERSGAFEGALPAYPFITVSLAYNAKDATLGFSRNAVKFADLAKTENQKAVAGAIESLGEGNKLFNTVLFAEMASDAGAGIGHGAADKDVVDKLEKLEEQRLATLEEEQRLATLEEQRLTKLEEQRLLTKLEEQSLTELEEQRLAELDEQKATLEEQRLAREAEDQKRAAEEAAARLQALYDILRGDLHATVKGVLIENTGFVSAAATNRLRAAFDGVAAKPQPTTTPLAYGPEAGTKSGRAFAAIDPVAPTTAFWGQAYGSWREIEGNADASGYSRNIGGFVSGFDGLVGEGLLNSTWRLGLLAGYSNSSLSGHASKTAVDGYQLGFYAGTQLDISGDIAGDALGLRFGVNLGHNELDTSRDDMFDRHEASYNAQTVQVFGELGYQIKTAYAGFEPFAAASHVVLKTDAFQEDGETSNLGGRSSSTDVTTTTLGLRASHDFALSETIMITARGMLGWSHAFGDVTPEARLAFAGGEAFTVEGLPIAEDAGIVEAGFDIGIGANTTLGLGYTGQFSSRANDNAVKADLTMRF